MALRPPPPFKEVFGALWQRRSLRHLTIALTLLYTMNFGLNPWYAAFMIRSHGMRTTELGAILGLIFGCAGVVGIMLGGHVAGRWFSGNERGQTRASGIAVACVVPPFIGFLLFPHKYQALLSLVGVMVVLNFFFAPTYTLLQRLVVDEMRATALAAVLLLTNLIGMGLGPQVVGVISDYLTPAFGKESLRYAMLTMSFVAVWAAIHFWIAGRTLKEDLASVARHGAYRPRPRSLGDRGEPATSKA